MEPFPDLFWRVAKTVLEEIKSCPLYIGEILHFGKKAVYRFTEGIKDIIVAKLIMTEQMKQPWHNTAGQPSGLRAMNDAV